MPHPLEIAADALRDRLRGLESPAAVVPGRHIVGGFWLAADTQAGRLTAEAGPVPGALIRLTLEVAARGRWLSLNGALDPAPLVPGTVLGLAAALSAERPLALEVAIRSGHGEGHCDLRFPDRLEAGPDLAVSVALLTVTEEMLPPGPAAWRNLMLQLPFQDLALTLHDLRLFALSPPLPLSATPLSPPAASRPARAGAAGHA